VRTRQFRSLSFVVIAAAPIVAVAVACGSSNSSGDDSSIASGDATLESSLFSGDSSKNGDSASTPDGQVDKTPACDDALPIMGDAPSFAKTIGICSNAATDGFGLVSASYSKGFDQLDAAADAHFDAEAYAIDGSVSVQAGLLPKFGDVIKPREGNLLGVLSSGYAREFDTLLDAGDGGGSFAAASALDLSPAPNGHAPPGFPQATPGCQQSKIVNDMIDVKLTLKAPADAHGFQFDFDFYASDWPDYVCSEYNDAFIAYVNSSTIHGDNIVFDQKHNPVSVNMLPFDRCTIDAGIACGSELVLPFPDGGYPIAHCEAGTAELLGTGYGYTSDNACAIPKLATQGGSSGWLTTTAPITPGETFTIEFMIWDALDGIEDSSALVDNFQWLSFTPPVATTRAE
jgi:hypothetical protein